MASRSPWNQQAPDPKRANSILPFRLFSKLPISHELSRLHRMRPFRAFGGLALVGATCFPTKGGTAMSTQSAWNQEGAASAGPYTHGH